MFFEVCTFGFEDFIFISRSLTRQSYDQFLVENCQLNKITDGKQINRKKCNTVMTNIKQNNNTNLYCFEVSSCQIVC